jgi:rubrerythrin
MNQKLGIEEALDIAMDMELKAEAFYAEAAAQMQDSAGRDLLGRLAAFENYHYQQLRVLVQSLERAGEFIDYQPRTIEEIVPQIRVGEAAATEPAELTDVVAILSRAIENEKVAGERYQALAVETLDPKGQRMFRTLAEEERVHQRILEDEFFSLSNRGSWAWSGLYGE